MPTHQNHHYVPAFLLREWQREDSKLSEFSWSNGRFNAARRQARSVAKEKHLYSTNRHLDIPDVQIERAVMGPKVDDPAAIVHKKLLQGDVNRLTNAEQEYWSQFILSLLFRSPSAIDDLRIRGRDKLEAGLTSTTEMDVVPEDRPELSLTQWTHWENPSAFEDLGVQTLELLITSEVLNPKILGATWGTVERHNSPHDFLISDKPLILVGDGLGGRFLLCLPLSPEQAFVAYSAPDIGKALATRPVSKFVKAVNLDTVRNAERYVYSTSDAQANFVQRYLACSKSSL